MSAQRLLRQRLDPLVLPLSLLGLGLLALHNWRLWRHDRAHATQARPATLPAPQHWPALPQVSVLVAAWNEAAHIERHIASFQRLRYPCKQLVLCAGGPDGTFELASRWCGEQVVVLRQQPGEGKQRALRRCLEQAGGSIIFLSDADCLLDDASFEQTLYPVASGAEHVSTGIFRPWPEQANRPFVANQAASQIYSAMHAPSYAPGITGANCALDRDLLERSGALDVPAATGTDYVLAKMLVRAGARIRQVPHSQVFTEYPASVPAYLRQQRRWLRNVVLHGWHYGARREVYASLRTSATGFGMLALPLATLLCGPVALALWLLLLAHALLSRVRYLGFARVVLGTPFSIRQILMLVPVLFLDFVAWSRTLLDYVSSHDRSSW